MWEIKPSFVTFITPSTGRDSLRGMVQSLLDQTEWNWLSYICFDGVLPRELKNLNPDINYWYDNHFYLHITEKKGHAGLVRNVILPLVETRWTAFLDDDDFLKNTYVESLRRNDNASPDKDIIIFTYKDIENGNTRPPKHLRKIECCEVGMSFAIKTEFIRRTGVRFNPGVLEDWGFLNDCVNAGATYLITHDIQYFVGHRSRWE